MSKKFLLDMWLPILLVSCQREIVSEYETLLNRINGWRDEFFSKTK